MKRRLFLKLFALTGLALFTPPLYARAARRETPRTVAELYVAMCEALPVGRSTVIRWSVTGEEYIEYALGVRIDEALARGIDPEAILCQWQWRTFLSQLAKAEPHAELYWRIAPEVRFYDGREMPFRGFPIGEVIDGAKARIYSRYLISSKPARFTEDELSAGAHRRV